MFDQILSLARDNDAASIRQLCRLGCPPSFANKVGQTALHIGGIWGSVDAVKALLECRADPNKQNNLRGSSPLHAVAMGKGPVERRVECIKLLVSFKAMPSMPDYGGELPLDCADDERLRIALGAAPLVVHKAVKEKSLAGLADAIKQVRDGLVNLSLEAANPQGETPLHLAVILGWREGVETLLKVRASVDTQNNQRQSPLHAALQDPRLAGLLIAAKADVNAQDADQEHDPRFASTTFKQNPYAHRSPLHYATELGNVWTARLLLEGQADPNVRDSKMETPLHLGIASLNEDSQIEVGCGVRVNGLQKKPQWNGTIGSVLGPVAGGTSGARWPVLISGEEVADGVLLKEENLQRLADDIVNLLLEARADVNLGNQVMGESRTTLHEVARLGDANLVRKVLAARADIDRQDAKVGLSALHLAARSKHHDVLRALIEARADLSQVTSSGKTAAELAETNGAPAATLALLRGSDAREESEAASGQPQTLESLTAEQRAMLFID
jgi:ankyrin repeat protein